MPTYDYECGKCGHKFEEFQNITAKLLKKCPSCGKMALHRLIGAGAGVIFKGAGFYCNDYKSPSYKSAEKNESSCSSKDKPADCKPACGSCCKNPGGKA